MQSRPWRRDKRGDPLRLHLSTPAHISLSSSRFSVETWTTTPPPPTPSPLPSRGNTCASTPRSVDDTAPCAWSYWAVNSQVTSLHNPTAAETPWAAPNLSDPGAERYWFCRRGALRCLCLSPGCSEPMGMKSGHIQDYQITASSIFRTLNMDMFTWEPGKARLDKQGKVNAWTSGHSDQSQWLQVGASLHLSPPQTESGDSLWVPIYPPATCVVWLAHFIYFMRYGKSEGYMAM